MTGSDGHEGLERMVNRFWNTHTANYSLKNFHEGVFRLTRLGRVVYDAISYLIEEMEAVHEDSLWQENYEKILGIAERHPSNPYVQSKLLDLICRHSESMILESGEDGSALALATLKTCRTQFESLMPKGFRHQIEPNLTGGNAANYEYFSCLYNGANIADSLGNRRTALAWARHSMRLHKNDSFGFRFIFEELVK